MNSSRKNRFVLMSSSMNGDHPREVSGDESPASLCLAEAYPGRGASCIDAMPRGESGTTLASFLLQDDPRAPIFSPAFDPAPVPRIPEGITDEEGSSLRTLAAVVLAYHQTVPSSMQDEYVRQLMKFAGEKAGQFVRMCSEH